MRDIVHVKPSARAHTVTPHCGSHYHPLRVCLTPQFLWRQAIGVQDFCGGANFYDNHWFFRFNNQPQVTASGRLACKDDKPPSTGKTCAACPTGYNSKPDKNNYCVLTNACDKAPCDKMQSCAVVQPGAPTPTSYSVTCKFTADKCAPPHPSAALAALAPSSPLLAVALSTT